MIRVLATGHRGAVRRAVKTLRAGHIMWSYAGCKTAIYDPGHRKSNTPGAVETVVRGVGGRVVILDCGAVLYSTAAALTICCQGAECGAVIASPDMYTPWWSAVERGISSRRESSSRTICRMVKGRSRQGLPASGSRRLASPSHSDVLLWRLCPALSCWVVQWVSIPRVDDDLASEVVLGVNLDDGSELPPIFGHRGGGLDAPENTLAAFREAKNNNASGIKFDLSFTWDNVAVIFHDQTL
ncbi:hypothetical protein HPB49_015926 [Dermacentor silvarum]|uniref:Uncharacterized protein n=1 Tax=Dermacentor silvarum TaxID=543639 RepID=A0ACB8DEH6_DERSI|nr:hypothetical protein HPB49_015926 [Dermacentor silvarum]